MGARKRRRRCELLFTLTPLLFSLFPLATRRQIKQARDLTRATPRGNELHGPDTRPEAPKPLGEEQERKIELSFFKFSFRGLGSALEIQARTEKRGLGEQANGGAPARRGPFLDLNPGLQLSLQTISSLYTEHPAHDYF